MKRRSVFPLLAAIVCGERSIAASSRKYRPCSVALPHHQIEYRLPDAIARELGPEKIHSACDPSIPFERGYQGIVGTMYEFNGPFWRGPPGALWFAVLMQQRSPDYANDITTIEGLQKYIAWWFPLVTKAGELKKTELNGASSVLRKFGEWDECWSFPVDQDMFVEFSLRVRLVARNWSGRWVKEARAMRDEIRSSILFRAK